jgi:hypothetical protein
MRATCIPWKPVLRASLLLVLLSSGVSSAHDFTVTDALVVLKTDGTYLVDLTVDLDALALGVSPRIDSAELAAELRAMTAEQFEQRVLQARETLARRVRIRFDGVKQQPRVSFPELGSPSTGQAEVPTVLGTTARLTGRIPHGAEELTFGASRAFKAVHVTILEQATAAGVKHVLLPGENSPPHRLGEAPVAPSTRRDVAARYLILGFEHILPRGLDHILFVLGLFLLSTRLGPLTWQVTAFTIAHTLTLGLSMYGLVSLPSRLVETLIALSIAYVAIENIVTSELKPWRPVLVFGFGLLHGLGFAVVLRELGLPQGEFVTALFSFNIGVELGQLSVIAMAFLAVGWFRERSWYRRAIVLPASLAISLVGLYWAAQRALAI